MIRVIMESIYCQSVQGMDLIGVQQVTHVATPEENAHINAYHGILKEVFKELIIELWRIELILKICNFL
jgi:hypothetical protein